MYENRCFILIVDVFLSKAVSCIRVSYILQSFCSVLIFISTTEPNKKTEYFWERIIFGDTVCIIQNVYSNKLSFGEWINSHSSTKMQTHLFSLEKLQSKLDSLGMTFAIPDSIFFRCLHMMFIIPFRSANVKHWLVIQFIQ